GGARRTVRRGVSRRPALRARSARRRAYFPGAQRDLHLELRRRVPELFAEDLFQLAEPVAERLGVHGEAVGDRAGVAGTTEPAQKRFGEPLAPRGAHRVERTEPLPGEFVDEFLVVEEQ